MLFLSLDNMLVSDHLQGRENRVTNQSSACSRFKFSVKRIESIYQQDTRPLLSVRAPEHKGCSTVYLDLLGDVLLVVMEKKYVRSKVAEALKAKGDERENQKKVRKVAM